MKTRVFKTRNETQLAFSAIGLGTAPLGEIYEILDERTSVATVEQGLVSGVRLFDTSPHYGNGIAESRVGAGLRRVQRSDVIVSTKIGRVMDPFERVQFRDPRHRCRPRRQIRVRGGTARDHGARAQDRGDLRHPQRIDPTRRAAVRDDAPGGRLGRARCRDTRRARGNVTDAEQPVPPALWRDLKSAGLLDRSAPTD